MSNAQRLYNMGVISLDDCCARLMLIRSIPQVREDVPRFLKIDGAAGECGPDLCVATGCYKGQPNVTVNGKTIEITVSGKFIYRNHVIGDNSISARDARRECERDRKSTRLNSSH